MVPVGEEMLKFYYGCKRMCAYTFTYIIIYIMITYTYIDSTDMEDHAEYQRKPVFHNFVNI